MSPSLVFALLCFLSFLLFLPSLSFLSFLPFSFFTLSFFLSGSSCTPSSSPLRSPLLMSARAPTAGSPPGARTSAMASSFVPFFGAGAGLTFCGFGSAKCSRCFPNSMFPALSISLSACSSISKCRSCSSCLALSSASNTDLCFSSLSSMIFLIRASISLRMRIRRSSSSFAFSEISAQYSRCKLTRVISSVRCPLLSSITTLR
mmetsp:Transcript_58635/g.156115  ORF Transcript_58635/g.156115 Transcript_58635/m.156115 type:complete len:204 (-) Transcript_58635:2761-3372(-)